MIRGPSDAGPVLVLDGVSKRWGNLTVLDQVDLVLEPGQLAWVGGDNGAGKTTLLRIASGLILPDGGSVDLCGLSPDHDRRLFYRQLGVLAAGDRGLYARLTVRQNLEFAAGLALMSGTRKRQAIATAVERFDLGALADRRVDRMSMGQRQRARLALTFLHEPTVVLLDEPRTSLDESGLGLLAAALEALTARHGAAVWCSPVGDEPSVKIDSSFVLRDGKLKPC
jgi:ABC-2 type transport system ATP-binding protein